MPEKLSPLDDRSFAVWRPAIVTTCSGAIGIVNIWGGWFSDWWLLLAIPMFLYGVGMIVVGLTWARSG